jgi:hypothetical protein
MMVQQQLENVEYFSDVVIMITNEARCTRKIKSKIAKAKAEFKKKKKYSFHQHIGLKFREETCKVLHVEHS